MSVNIVRGVTTGTNQRFASFATAPKEIVEYTKLSHNEHESLGKHSSNAGMIATTLLGVGTALVFIAKKQGFLINPKKILKTPMKDMAIFKIYNKKQPNAKELVLKEPQILTLATSSVAGGLLGGALFDDKKHFKAKAREAVNQLLGNVLVPVMCVGASSRIFNHYEPQLIKYMPQIKDYNPANKFMRKFAPKFSDKTVKNLNEVLSSTVKCTNKFMQVLPLVTATGASLCVGIVAGNRVSNFINEKIFHKKAERKIHKTDFAPHVDDLSLAITLMAGKSPLTSAISRTVPAFLCVPGLEVANHR